MVLMDGTGGCGSALESRSREKVQVNVARVFKPLGWVLFLTLILLSVPKIAGIFADSFDYSRIDPDGSYAWLTVHHLAQAAIFLVLMMGTRSWKPVDFRLGWGNKKVGIAYVLRFILYFSLYLLGFLAFSIVTQSLQPFPFPLNARNIIGYLSFQLLVTGPSEEMIFRAFALTMLGLYVQGHFLHGKISRANVLAALIFGLAHVSFSFAPFQVTYSANQVLYAAGLGLFYGDCYEKSGSVIYPMIMHSMTNVLSVGAIAGITALLR